MDGPANLLRSPGRRAAAVFLLVLAVYVAGLAPGVLWGDQAEIQRDSRSLGFSFHIRGYPLYRLLTFAAASVPVGEVAFRVSLLSALAAAAAVACCYLMVEGVTKSRSAGLLASLALTFSHGFWTVAEIAEVYALHLLLVALIGYLLLRNGKLTRRRLLLLGFVAALGWLHHWTIAFVVPPALLVLWLRRRELSTIRGGRLWALVAALPLCVPPLILFLIGPLMAEAARTGGPGIGERIVYLGKFTLLNFPSPALVLGAAGLIVCLRRWKEHGYAYFAASFLASLGPPMAFSWHGDQHVFFLPAFLHFAILSGVGAHAIFVSRTRVFAIVTGAVAVLPVAAYTGAAVWLMRPGPPDPLGVPPAYYRSLLLPPRFGLDDPRRFAERVLDHLPVGARLVSGWGEGHTILYLMEIEGLRPDLDVSIYRGEAALRRMVQEADGPLYLTTFPDLPDRKLIDALPEGYEAAREGPLYRVRRSR